MHKAYIVLVFGIWVAILPLLGFPYSLKSFLTTISGLLLIYVSFVLCKEFKTKDKKEKTFDNFSENEPSTESTENEGEI
jgi:hypothetical protein